MSLPQWSELRRENISINNHAHCPDVNDFDGKKGPTFSRKTIHLLDLPPISVQEMPTTPIKISTKNVESEIDDFALPSEHFLPKVAEKKLKKELLPLLNDYSILNFTSYRFSYFMMPGYIKHKNEQVNKLL